MSKDAAKFYDQYHTKYTIPGEDHPVMKMNRVLYKRFFNILSPRPGKTLLDLSSGQGLFLQSAAMLDPSLKLYGLDLSKKAVADARKRLPDAKIKVGDAMKTGYKTGSFDYVTCLGSLEHYPDPVRGAKEIARILKKGGRTLVQVPNLFFLGYIYLVWKTGEEPHEAGQNQYEWFHTRGGWEEIFDEAGLKIVGLEKYNDMYATERVPRWMVWLYTIFIQPLVPMNFSYCFCYVLEKK